MPESWKSSVERKTFYQLMSTGIDIGKNMFHLVGVDRDSQLVVRKHIKRLELVATFEELPGCIVRVETCLSRSS
ncbi:hypothetical protein [Thalassovita sp.]|uniref:hypothetical protein n=1 Tax=Thalassovita sp. TaxID=1979401 RepID=UPI002881FA7C|nr:hypothetical protein [Thalassovita sp.]MDF1804705.1 hypothetical protein [Thalassovita sp.]